MAAILEFALEESKVTVDTAIFLEFENDVFLALRHGLFVLGLTWVEVRAHDDSESPRFFDSWVLGVHLLPKLFSNDLVNTSVLLIVATK